MALRRTYIREWRKFLGLSQKRLAERMDYDKGNLSKLERGLLPYNQEVLEGAAEALGVAAATLLSRPPPQPDQPDPWTVLEGMRADEWPTATKVLEAIKKAS